MRAQSFLLKGNSLDDLAVVIYYVRWPNYMWKHIARTSIGVVSQMRVGRHYKLSGFQIGNFLYC